MIRISAFVWILVLALLGIGLFQVKYNVQSKEAELRGINKQIAANRSAIHVLEAEWSYLNDPTRLADLARRHTDLTPTQAPQLKRFADLPPRPATAQPDLPSLTPPPLVSSTQPVPTPVTPGVVSASVGSTAQTPNASNGGQAGITPVSTKATSDQTSNQPASSPTATNSKAATAPAAKPGADEVIDAILADMQRQQAASPPPPAGDQ
jgi:hypothetical protein